MRRYGLQPMMVISSDDQLPETAAVLIFRWARRYRSELGPLWLGAVTLLAGTVLHVTHPGWRWPVLTIAAMAAAVRVIFGRWLGLPPLAERLYAAAATVAAGGWLAAATATGPLHAPLPQLLAVGGLVLAVP
ncbi:MAG TPA: hypothetical protein VNF47_20470 [Streptosporangiaceae bacterium]|nr:hypothetical protein [Streptosporangiaceae bacterium]